MGRPERYANTWVRQWVVWGGMRDGRYSGWAVPGMGGRYGGRAVRGQGGTQDLRAVRTRVARSLNFAFRAVRACEPPPWNNKNKNSKNHGEEFGHLGPKGRSSPSPSL